MGFIRRVVEVLNGAERGFQQEVDVIEDVKRNLRMIFNTRPDDCAVFEDGGLFSIAHYSLESNQVIEVFENEVLRLISNREKRIKVISVRLNTDRMPWSLALYLECALIQGTCENFTLQIDFSSNRYCEIR